MTTTLLHWEMLQRVTMKLVTSKKELGMSLGKSHTKNVTQSFLTTYQTVIERVTLIRLLKWTAIPTELKGWIIPNARTFIAQYHHNHLMKSNRSFMWTLMQKMRVLHLDLCLSCRLILMNRMKLEDALLNSLKKYLNVRFSVWSKRTQRVMMNMLSWKPVNRKTYQLSDLLYTTLMQTNQPKDHIMKGLSVIFLWKANILTFKITKYSLKTSLNFNSSMRYALLEIQWEGPDRSLFYSRKICRLQWVISSYASVLLNKA